jgi:hypothetical protein
MGTGEPRRRAAQGAAALGSVAISSLGLVLLMLQLIDVFVRHQWGGIGPDAAVLTPAPVAPLPFLWPGDTDPLLLAAAAMLVLGLITAVLAIRSLLRSRQYPGLLSGAGRLVLTVGTAAASAQILDTFLSIWAYAGGSICATVKLLPWLELSALLGLIGAVVGLRALISIGQRTDRSPLKAVSLAGATVGLGGAVIGLCTFVVVVQSVVARQCPM